MKILFFFNWFVLVLNLVLCAYAYYTTANAPSGILGRNLAYSLVQIILILTICAGLLNLVQVKWVRILACLLLMLPGLFLLYISLIK